MRIAVQSLLLLWLVVGSSSCTTNHATPPALDSLQAAPATEPPREPPAVLEERIRRIEHGLLLPVVISGQPLQPMTLADRMAFYKVPGLSIAFVDGGRITWARGHGVRESSSAEPVTTETLFEAGSISKAVTAIAALRLVQAGKLDLDEDVNKRLVSWKVPENEFTRRGKVTLRRLLSHDAGVGVPTFIGYVAGERVPTLVQVLDGLKPANTPPIRVERAPGTGFRYSGGGYVIVQQLLVDRQGKPFPELMRELIFQPLGMQHSTFDQAPLPQDMASLAAAGHDSEGRTPAGKWRAFPEMAAAGLWTTPSDLARLVIEVQQAQVGRSTEFLSTATVDEMLAPQVAGWGLGFAVAGAGRTARFGHGGSTMEFNSQLVAYVPMGQGVAIMSNSLRGERLISELLRSIAHEYGWGDFRPQEKTIARIDPKVYDDYVGEYRFDFSSDFVLTIRTEGGNLITELKQPTSVSRAELHPESEATFFRKDVDVEVTFVRDPTGRATHLIFRQDGEDLRATRIQ